MNMRKKKIFLLFPMCLALIYSSVLQALTIKDASIEELTIESDLIVRAKVIARDCKWEDEALKKINTIVYLSVDEYLKGSGKDNIKIVQMGGKIDDVEDIIYGTPRLNLNDELLLFLVKNNNHYRIHSIALGFFKIELNEKLQKVAMNNLLNVKLVSLKSNRVIAAEQAKKYYLLTELTQQIKSIVK